MSASPPSSLSNTATKGNIIQTMSAMQVMKHQESTTYRTLPYLECAAVTAQDRSALCQWGMSCVDACNIDRKICSIAIGYFDRFMSSRGSKVALTCLSDQRDFQLAFVVSSYVQHHISPHVFTDSILTQYSPSFLIDLHLQTCLLIALKGHMGVNVSATYVSETICDGMYDPIEFIPMELEILKFLGWRLNGPTPQDFIQHFAQLLPASTNERFVKMLVDEATTNSEVALLNYEMALKAPSRVAFLSISTAIRSLGGVGSLPYLDRLDISDWLNLIECIVGRD
jgi:hypothetical protein